MPWGTDNAELTLVNSALDFGTTLATPATPVGRGSMNLFAKPFTRAVAAVTTLGNLCRQEKKVSFSSDASSDSTGKASLSPASGGKQAPMTDLRCPECDFVPTGKVEKASTYMYKHRQTHLKELRFSCQQCGKTYSRKDNVTAHAKKTHGGSPAPGGKKRPGSGNIDQVSVHRKKSRSYSNESAALQESGQWEPTF